MRQHLVDLDVTSTSAGKPTAPIIFRDQAADFIGVELDQRELRR